MKLIDVVDHVNLCSFETRVKLALQVLGDMPHVRPAVQEAVDKLTEDLENIRSEQIAVWKCLQSSVTSTR